MSGTRRPSNRAVALVVLAVALLLAGVVSFYAAGSPDGLNRVALDQGFADTQEAHAAGNGPFAGYATRDVEDERLSGGLAGVVGVLVVLALAGGLTFAVRRRDTSDG
ncbi:MAG: PDGLE domain-containing protein [Nocardioides sp.]|nr:PDGLE domain-containing protein [Nocardioides sp.]